MLTLVVVMNGSISPFPASISLKVKLISNKKIDMDRTEREIKTISRRNISGEKLAELVDERWMPISMTEKSVIFSRKVI